MLNRRTLLAATAASLAAPAVLRAQTGKHITFFYPIAVGGPLAAIIDEYCQDFGKETGIVVSPVYAGNYTETTSKVVSAIKDGHGPALAILLAAELHTLVDLDILMPLNDAWVGGFYDAFLANSRKDGKLWSVPFQRSTAVDYYNKAAFAEAGLNPEAFPTTWDGLANAAEKLTRRDASGRVTRWGFKLASDAGNAVWSFGALANQAGHVLMNQAGTEVYFNDPKAIEALAFWRSLAFDRKVMPEGVTTWDSLATDFTEGNAAIIQSTTGNLTNLRTNAPFAFGVGGLPGKIGVRTVVGGGYLYFMKHTDQVQREAAGLEGASRLYVFRRVTWPLLMPTTLFIVVNAVINAFRLVDHVVVMTRGGPDNATNLLLYHIYETGFRFWDTAAAATLTMVLLGILAALAGVQFLLLGRRAHYR